MTTIPLIFLLDWSFAAPMSQGKTGIMKAIQLGLFTDASTTRQDVRQLTRWGRDEGFRIELTLENRDGQWDIIRDFDTKHVEQA